MTRIATCCAIVLPMLAVQPVSALQQPGTRTATINVAKVFDGYKMTKELEGRFDVVRERIATEAASRRKSMENQIAGLQAFDPASKDYQDRRMQILQAEAEYKVWLEMEDVRLKAEHMGWLRKIYEDVRAQVAAVAKENGYDLVLTYDELSQDMPDSAALRREIVMKKVIFSSERIDITETVLARLNKTYDDKGGLPSQSPPPITVEEPATVVPATPAKP